MVAEAGFDDFARHSGSRNIRQRSLLMMAQAPEVQKQKVLDVGVSGTSYVDLTATCRDWIASRRNGTGGDQARYLCFLSVHGIITAHEDQEVRAILNAADVVAPDGMPVVWALRSFGLKNQDRVYG